MKFKEIIAHLTGISCPIFGLSWNPSETECKKAYRIVRFLEDRRVLYNPYEMECPEYCTHSIIEIRHFLTNEIQDVSSDTKLYSFLQAMLFACRKFLNQFSDKNKEIRFYINNYNNSNSWKFNSSLGELRGTFGIMLAQIAAAYGTDIEGELATILPEKDSEE